MDDLTPVQFAQMLEATRVGDTVPAPRNPNDPASRVTIDVPEDQVDFIDRFVLYKNELEKPPRVQWKRKSVVESLVAAAVAELQTKQMKRMIRALGPLPKTEEEMVEYVKRAKGWRERQGKKTQ